MTTIWNDRWSDVSLGYYIMPWVDHLHYNDFRRTGEVLIEGWR